MVFGPQGFGSRLSRRRLIQVGGISVLGLSLPQLIRAGSAIAQAPGQTGSRAADAKAIRGDRSPAPGANRSCIFIVQYGGCSHIDTLDPRPEAPLEIRGPYQPIATAVPGMQVSEMLPSLARLADRYCLVRSMTHKDSGHDGGMHVCMTGHSSPREETPYFGSILAKLRPATRNIPSYVWIQNLAGDVRPWYLTGGFLGATYAPMLIGKDLENLSKPDFRVTEFDPAPGVTVERLQGREGLRQRVDPADRQLAQARAAGAFDRFQERAMDLITGPEARRAFDLKHEPDPVRNRYGRHPLGQNLLMARRLVEAGVRLVSVTAWTGTPPGEAFKNVQTWDMHSVLYSGDDSMYGKSAYGLGWALPNLDQSVSALLDDLDQRGLLESTLVVLVGEFGRSPRFEHPERKGRAHWPACYTALLAGGGVRGGAVYGASDKIGAYVKDKPVSPEDFGATLFHALGVPPETRFGPDGFSFRVNDGQPIREILA